MAIDTANKRRSVALMPPIPDGTLATPDFQQIGWLYAGIVLRSVFSTSIRLRILNAILAALDLASVTLHAGTAHETTYTKPSGLTVHTVRDRPIQHADLPEMVAYLLTEPPPVSRAGGLVDRTVPVGVECRIKVPAATAPDDAMDPYINWAVVAVMSDETLGGVAHRIDEGATERPPADDEEVLLNRAGVAFNVRYQTRRNDLRTAT